MYRITLNKPFLDITTRIYVNSVIDSGMVSQGEMVKQFERDLKRYIGCKRVLAVSSCTAGMWMIADMYDHSGSIWSVPAFTFPAVHRIGQSIQKNKKCFSGINGMDVDLNTYNVTTSELARSRSEMIWPIHQYGMPCGMNAINLIERETNALVIHDAACALGSEYNGKKIGSTGTAVFSFHGRKIITTGEGGAIATDDSELYERLVQMRQFGRNDQGEFVGTGLNFKMSDVSAAMGIGQLKNIDNEITIRRRIASIYDEELDGVGISTPYKGVTDRKTNYQSYVVKVPPCIRDKVIEKMKKHGIEVQVGSYDQSNGNCKNSAFLAASTIALPIYRSLTKEQQCEVIRCLKGAISEAI
jgi:dTDP-4-amino-4,6-dideoxygalactose transaminase